MNLEYPWSGFKETSRGVNFDFTVSKLTFGKKFLCLKYIQRIFFILLLKVHIQNIKKIWHFKQNICISCPLIHALNISNFDSVSLKFWWPLFAMGGCLERFTDHEQVNFLHSQRTSRPFLKVQYQSKSSVKVSPVSIESKSFFKLYSSVKSSIKVGRKSSLIVNQISK